MQCNHRVIGMDRLSQQIPLALDPHSLCGELREGFCPMGTIFNGQIDLVESHINPAVTKNNYDKEAKYYDLDYATLSVLACDRITIDNLRRAFRSCNAVNPWLLDIGCGTGFVGEHAVSQSPNIFYEGIDISDGMLNVAKHKIDNGVFQGNLSIGDQTRLKFNENQFDIVTSIYGPVSYSQPFKVWSEMNRVLKKGGKLICMPYSTRVGAGIGCGFTTAAGEKHWYYNEERAMRMALQNGFDEVTTLGINYFGNWHEKGRDKELEEYMELAMNQAPGEKAISWLAEQYDQVPDRSANYTPDQWDKMLKVESVGAREAGVDPGLARFMMIQATKI